MRRVSHTTAAAATYKRKLSKHIKKIFFYAHDEKNKRVDHNPFQKNVSPINSPVLLGSIKTVTAGKAARVVLKTRTTTVW